MINPSFHTHFQNRDTVLGDPNLTLGRQIVHISYNKLKDGHYERWLPTQLIGKCFKTRPAGSLDHRQLPCFSKQGAIFLSLILGWKKAFPDTRHWKPYVKHPSTDRYVQTKKQKPNQKIQETKNPELDKVWGVLQEMLPELLRKFNICSLL